MHSGRLLHDAVSTSQIYSIKQVRNTHAVSTEGHTCFCIACGSACAL